MNCEEIFQKFSQTKALVVGDVMLDRYLHGKVSRISPEAPVPVVEWGSEEDRPGGAANVALNVAAMGATPILCGVIGNDPDGERLFNLLPKSNLSGEGMLYSTHRRTTVKTRILSGNQQLLRLDREDRHDLTDEEQQAFLQKIEKLVRENAFNVMILQDYNKGVLTEGVIRRLLQLSHEFDIPVAVDPKFNNFWTYRGVELFKPNLKEVRDALRLPVKNDEAALREATKLIVQKLGNRRTLITLSEKGVFLSGDEEGKIYPTQSRNVADVCGAGDTVIAVAALALAAKLPDAQLANLVNLAGGQVVEKAGVVPVDKAQLFEEFQNMKHA